LRATAWGAAKIRARSLVVFPPFLGVGEDFIGVLYLFEALLGLGVVPISVRMVLASQLPVGTPDLLLRSPLTYPKHFV
jgi:hypothetical protein